MNATEQKQEAQELIKKLNNLDDGYDAVTKMHEHQNALTDMGFTFDQDDDFQYYLTDTTTTYRLADSNFDKLIEADSMDEALHEAEEDWESCDGWDTESGPMFINVSVQALDDEGNVTDTGSVDVYIPMEETVCKDEYGEWGSDGEHAGMHTWGDVVTKGNGGGVIVIEMCNHCQCKRITDTWYQRPTDGQVHDDDVVTYER